MELKIFDDKLTMAKEASERAASTLKKALASRGHARIIAATGMAQFDFLDMLTARKDIDWPNVEMFHLDEYIGISPDHPASFVKFLHDRLVDKTGIVQAHFLNGEGDPAEIVKKEGAALSSAPIDIAFVGVGENGHLAFNDPPADFETEEPYLIVDLDSVCRNQQVGEGWFKDLSEVPTQAISMSCRQIMKANQIIAIVPDTRKAKAVQACFGSGEISNMAPASLLRNHPNAEIYLDRNSAALLPS